MDNRLLRGVQHITALLYVSIFSLFWFLITEFLIRRINENLLPDVAIVWILIIAWVLIVPLPYISTSQSRVWYGVTFVAGFVSGVLLYQNFIIVLFMLLGVSWFSIRKVGGEIGAKDFASLFLNIFLVFGLVFILGYVIPMGEGEVSRYVTFLVLLFFISVIGVLVSLLQFKAHEYSGFSFMKQWGSFSGFIWLLFPLLLIGSVFILFIFRSVYPIFVNILMFLVTPIVKVIFMIIPFLQSFFVEGANNSTSEELDTEKGLDEFITEEMTIASKEFDFVLMIVGIIFLLVVVSAIIYYTVRKIKQIKNRNLEIGSTSNGNVIIEDADNSKESKSNWLESLFLKRATASDIDLHEVRKQYRQLLKMLRKKGLWEHDAMTVQQLNRRVYGLEISSSFYERLRYGDQSITNEELEQFRSEIQRIMKQLKKVE